MTPTTTTAAAAAMISRITSSRGDLRACQGWRDVGVGAEALLAGRSQADRRGRRDEVPPATLPTARGDQGSMSISNWWLCPIPLDRYRIADRHRALIPPCTRQGGRRDVAACPDDQPAIAPQGGLGAHPHSAAIAAGAEVPLVNRNLQDRVRGRSRRGRRRHRPDLLPGAAQPGVGAAPAPTPSPTAAPSLTPTASLMPSADAIERNSGVVPEGAVAPGRYHIDLPLRDAMATAHPSCPVPRASASTCLPAAPASRPDGRSRKAPRAARWPWPRGSSVRCISTRPPGTPPGSTETCPGRRSRGTSSRPASALTAGWGSGNRLCLVRAVGDNTDGRRCCQLAGPLHRRHHAHRRRPGGLRERPVRPLG